MKVAKIMLVMAMVLSLGIFMGCGKQWSPLSGGLVNASLEKEPVVEEVAPMTYKINEKVLFAFDKYNLDAEAMSTVDKVAGLMKEYPDTLLALEGYTDHWGPSDYNMTLSINRANAVKDALIAKGVAAERIVKAEGFGKTKLIPNVTNRENRRVLILSTDDK
jgi:outer membrane protein OmpA-like peptidoglycan-associated protein